MANNNVQNVKFLRNGSVFTPSGENTARQVALEAMNGQLGNLADGTAILGRYQETNGIVKTLVGFAYVSGDTKTLTVFDVDGAGADVDAKILAAIQALDAEITSSDGTNVQVKVTEVDGKITAVNITTDNTVNSGDVASAIETEIGKLDVTDTAVNGQYVSQVSQADGKISVTRVALPTVAAISETGKPITAVSESLGEISATAGTIDAQYVNINDAGGIITATNVEDALAEIAAEIDAMDKTASAEDGKVVTTISETDGVVSETKANVKDLQLGGYSKDTTATGDIASTDTINAALSKLENKAAAITIGNTDHSINVITAASGTDVAVNIKSGEKVIKLGDDGIYTNLNLVEITGSTLPAEVKVRYELRDSDNTKIGESIDIPKDSHIVSINYITGGTHAQNLEYVYIDVSGETKTTYVDMSALVLEAEFASGVTVDAGSHIVHGVVDTTSEKDGANVAFLTVGADGFKISGIKDEIDRKINALDVAVINPGAGKYIYAIEENDGKIAASGSNVSEAVLNNYSKGSASGAVASTDTVNQAISKLEVRLDGELAALDADVSGNSTHVTVGVVEEDGKITAVTVSESNIANADDLATLSGKTVTTITSTNGSITASINDAVGNKTYNIETDASKVKMSGFTADASGFTAITEASSVTQAVKAIETVILDNEQTTSSALNDLDGRLDVIESGYVETVKVNNVALTETGNAVNVQISSTPATGTSASPIVVNTNNSTGAVTLEIQYLDCGTY